MWYICRAAQITSHTFHQIWTMIEICLNVFSLLRSQSEKHLKSNSDNHVHIARYMPKTYLHVFHIANHKESGEKTKLFMSCTRFLWNVCVSLFFSFFGIWSMYSLLCSPRKTDGILALLPWHTLYLMIDAYEGSDCIPFFLLSNLFLMLFYCFLWVVNHVYSLHH